ncbi:T7SS effector LXG polymorphic toxin [Bacillus inaquosorum]|uniref:T7SS effector LXG polymorphic toxin n=1 Tax=Bacillus inaquosorum TaxID=483913 RepID=UPI00227DBB35|nr:T7SS effector LXG polymorphic toxin [Bacillus inaquosorum]MCY7759488.1 T7SS effector LXG polymorphic toxin [Bacillus inaquosorum]MCY7952839.1 T7SS effector LXG polymorphic toxin [Bacillus inaquosorum]MCY8148417.1 T7SS effector LXG polymorphic toxin [Bacillus inaquosorum]MCY8732689.1 T7SS effector LXG polymorphic toxin [Bacillus inaquosorum]MCY8852371.1 T7SS effector LXG polymorphic toxin [Bacillus inaquosorum]
MSKVFESQSLIDEAKSRKKQYETLEEQLNTLKKAFQGVADLGDDFKGKGADNIKAFFQGQAEIVDSWLTLVSAQIAFLNGISGDIKDQELNDSYVETSFLDHELPNGDLKASEIVSAHKEEIDSILSGISDIIDLDMYTLDDYADKMGDAQKIRRDTITAVDKLDESLTTEYQNLESLDNAVLTKYSVLMQATSNGKSASPMYYDKKAFHSNEVYKSVIEVEKQGTTYIDAKAQQAEARRLQEKAEEEANKPWYEKTWEGVCNFTGEVTGYYDYKRATEGVDPVTGEKLSAAERVTAGAMAAAGFIPVVGWAGRAFKGGKAIYKTGKAAIAAEHALDAYKTGKSLDILKMSEMGAYGLVASNGFSEAVTGRDMFGNKVSEEKRKQGALEAALSLVGAGALAKHIDKGIPLAKSPQAAKVELGKKILDQVKEFKVPTNVKIRVHKTVTPDGTTFPIVHADVKTKAVKDLGIVKMVGRGSSGSTTTRLIPGTPGKVTGGSSTKLGKNMFEQMGLPRSTKRTPYQAQHIIPKEFRSHPVLKKLGMDMDDASNGFFLRVPDDDISATSRHKGYHSVYSSFVRKKLDEIDVNQSVDVIEKQVYDLQQKLRELQEKGLPLYMRDDYLETELKKIKEKGLEAYKLERKEGSASRKPVWKRGGGATVDLWERWYNK